MEKKQLNILIADDEEALRFSLASILEMEGYDVKTAGDGNEALKLVGENEFDIAFFDIRMPGLNGVETFKQIKKTSPETIVVMMTAYAMNDLIKESVKEGAFACISKPFEIEDVLNTVKEISQKRAALLVNLDEQSADVLHQILKSYGYMIINENDSKKALSFAKRRKPDVIFAGLSSENSQFINDIKNSKDLSGRIVTAGAADLSVKGVKNLEVPIVKSAAESLLTKRYKKKIAAVSSDTISSNNLKVSLIAKGYDVSCYASADNFFKFSDWGIFDIIICDASGGDCKAEDFTRKIKESGLKRKLIVSSEIESQENQNSDEVLFFHKDKGVSKLIELLEE